MAPKDNHDNSIQVEPLISSLIGAWPLKLLTPSVRPVLPGFPDALISCARKLERPWVSRSTPVNQLPHEKSTKLPSCLLMTTAPFEAEKRICPRTRSSCRSGWCSERPPPQVDPRSVLALPMLWMDKIHFASLRNHGQPLFVGICGGVIIPGILFGAGLCPSTVGFK